jgi:hypothetical protein
MIAPIVVLLAEAMTLVWFLAYLTLACAFAREGAAVPRPPLDPVARALIRSVQLAFGVGLTLIVALSALRLL